MYTLLPVATLLFVIVAQTGCGNAKSESSGKAPRPVTTMILHKHIPETSFMVSGRITSWKTEQIGFEIPGRVLWVLEPGRNIEGRVFDPEGQLIKAGTPLAQIDPERYDVALESAEAAVEVAKLNKEVIEIRVKDALPADIASANADLELAQIQFERTQRLQQQNAISKAEFDQAENQVATQRARLLTLQSSEKQAKAELSAADAQIKQAEQSLRDAQRDLKNTTLYAAYRGQISETQAVPGSVVSAGSPILTVQMMDPIKVEVELSAEQSRVIRRRRQVPIMFGTPNGETREQNAFVYMVDPSADPATRTFTLTLLIMNQTFRSAAPQEIDSSPAEDDETASTTASQSAQTSTQTSAQTSNIARSKDAWPLNLNKMMGADPGVMLVEEGSILVDDEGSYVYQMTNVEFGETMPEVAEVRPLRIRPTELRIPFLGNWIFRAVEFLEPEKVSESSLLVGKLEFPDGSEEAWDQQSVIIDAGEQWTLRPGDLVNVNLSSDNIRPGFYVPVDAIYQESGETFLFLATNAGTARKISVKAALTDDLDTGSMIRIEPLEESLIVEGARIVVDGVHFLQDGEAINVLGKSENASEYAKAKTASAAGGGK